MGAGAWTAGAGGGLGGLGAGAPVIVEIAFLPRSVVWYLAGPPKRSTLYSMKPRDVSWRTDHTVIHSELSPMASSSSALLSPSLLLVMAVRAFIRCGSAATFRRALLWPLGSAGQTQTPVFIGFRREYPALINPARLRFNRFNRLINCFSFGLKSKPEEPVTATMEVVTEYADQRTELEEKIRSFEAEKASLLASVASLKEKIANFELEKSANALESEVQALRTEKAVLEEKAAAYEAEAGYALPPVATEGV